MTAKNTSSTDEALPFGAIPDGDTASSGTARKKATRKKAAKKVATKKAATKKAATKKTATKKTATKKTATEKTATKKAAAKKVVTKKAATKKVVTRKADTEEAATEKAVTEEAGTKKAASRRTSTDEHGTVPAPAAPPVEFAPAPVPVREDAPRAESRGDSDAAGEGKRRRTRRGRRRRGPGEEGSDERSEGEAARNGASAGSENNGATTNGNAPTQEGEGTGRSRRRRRRRGKKSGDGGGDGPRQDEESRPAQQRDQSSGEGSAQDGSGRSRKSRRRGRGKNKGQQEYDQKVQGQQQRDGDEGGGEKLSTTGTGMFVLDKGNVSVLRRKENGYLAAKDDIYVPKKLVQKHKLRDGMMISGPLSRGYKHKFQLDAVDDIDGQEPKYWNHKPLFQNLTSVDPDFHYAVGDITDNVSMRVVDLIAPIGRGQRGLLVAPPRTGKTTIMREFAAGIEKGYPDVHLMVLLIDERPEEATEWKRSVDRGEVFVSTADETSKHHIQVAEVVWKRAMRLVEMGEDVVLLLDSITRLARAYNNQAGPGRTMSGGLDSRAMERPRKIFGSARNTVEAGSLTILGTTLVETGSRMDQLVFEEFKGTGNMELMLNRKLADRRIFPAIDIEKSGTRKEEKLVGMRRLKQIHILRRVLARMHFAEATELLITRLIDVEKTTDFLDRFTVDPEA